jgi:site-specific recombinase XerD
MFATEAVNGGLPVHIVARLLGHKNLNTTQAYMNPRELHQTGEILQVAC